MRRWLARELYPEAFQDAERYDYVRCRLSEVSQWCGYGFPEIAAAIDWVTHDVNPGVGWDTTVETEVGKY